MPSTLLESQLQTLERPGPDEDDVFHVDVSQPPTEVIRLRPRLWRGAVLTAQAHGGEFDARRRRRRPDELSRATTNASTPASAGSMRPGWIRRARQRCTALGLVGAGDEKEDVLGPLKRRALSDTRSGGGFGAANTGTASGASTAKSGVVAGERDSRCGRPRRGRAARDRTTRRRDQRRVAPRALARARARRGSRAPATRGIGTAAEPRLVGHARIALRVVARRAALVAEVDVPAAPGRFGAAAAARRPRAACCRRRARS